MQTWMAPRSIQLRVCAPLLASAYTFRMREVSYPRANSQFRPGPDARHPTSAGYDAHVRFCAESPMQQSLVMVSLVVRDYEEALAFYVGRLGFVLVEDSPVPEQGKRWVVIEPPGSQGARLLLARASTDEQVTRIGAQTGGRVFLFLHTDDFWRDYHRYRAQGVEFIREPRDEPYGTVGVFRDLYGNLWDLIQPR